MSDAHAPLRGNFFLLLALCPALAVSDTAVNAIGLGAVILLALPGSALVLALLRRWLTPESTLLASMLVAAGVIACLELLVSAWFPELRIALAIFLPLVVSNAVFIEHIERQHAGTLAALRGSVPIALTVAATLLLLGLARELVGRGSLLHGAGGMLAGWAGALEINVFRVDMGFLLAMLPPGAFIALGLLIALRNCLLHTRS